MSYIYCIRMKMDWLISIFIYEGLPNILNRKIFSLACYYRGFVHTLKKWLLFLVKKCCVNTLERNFYWHFSLRCVVGWTIPWCWILWLPFWYYICLEIPLQIPRTLYLSAIKDAIRYIHAACIHWFIHSWTKSWLYR